MNVRIVWIYITNAFGILFQQRYSAVWDSCLDRLINTAEIEELGIHTITFRFNSDLYEVWIASRYYSFGHLRTINRKQIYSELRRPSIATMCRLADLVDSVKQTEQTQEEEQMMAEVYAKILSDKASGDSK